MTKRAFGELESAILRIMQSGSKMTVKEVHALLKSNDKYNSIMTVMHRLAEKGALSRAKNGACYEYWIVENKKPSFLQQLKQKMFGIKPIEFVSYLIDEKDEISDEELDRMEDLIRQAKLRRNKHDR